MWVGSDTDAIGYNAYKHQKLAYFPFAGGLRGCIGGYFAMTEAVVAIATLLARFSVASESPEIPLLTNITLRPAGPVRCRLYVRQSIPTSP